MQKFKSVMVFVLSVILAFETGVLAVVLSFLSAFSDASKTERTARNRVSYRNYYNR